jgi:hypothetical protein
VPFVENEKRTDETGHTAVVSHRRKGEGMGRIQFVTKMIDGPRVGKRLPFDGNNLVQVLRGQGTHGNRDWGLGTGFS